MTSPSPLIECVPNFSEGRNMSVINAIGNAVSSVDGARLLNIEPDKDYNRTVVTFVGTRDAVVEAAFRATSVAAERIDMRFHSGEHPRLGATDVVPFIPVSGVSMDDCIQLARRFGERVSSELKIPVYLYEFAASSPERRNLSDIRKGEYEGLESKLKDPAWTPDFGPAVFNAKSGATVTGARKFLIAYNVNLATEETQIAQEIALRIRESGRVQKDAQGNPVKDARGKTLKIPGTLKSVKAMGVFLERHRIAQVSINLVDYSITSMHDAFEEVARLAKELGTHVTGSELVGLSPLEAFRKACRFYEPSFKGSDRDTVALACKKLGLDQLEPFVADKKIIEFMIMDSLGHGSSTTI
ncbi:MAG: glutamate formimidoyltransferase [Ignavibacteria bacterium RIFCSPLOWO2_12_FULL_56_21]|nr:MAG: glutamate formimidoyltransferase [Ignavibacteria bacterium RIFCSPLOWO2_12_FULL_56_21]